MTQKPPVDSPHFSYGKNLFSQSQIIHGVVDPYEPFALRDLILSTNKPFIYVATTTAKADQFFEQFKIISSVKCFILPGWDCLPYDRVSPSSHIFNARIENLSNALMCHSNNELFCIITTADAFIQKLIPKSNLKQSSLHFKVGDTIERDDFINTLTIKGYTRVHTVRGEGEYAVRGSLMDLYPLGQGEPVRMDFFGNTLETIRNFNPISQNTTGNITSFNLKIVGEIILNEKTIETFRKNYRTLFGPNNDLIYENISQGRKHPGMEHWLPLFYDNCDHIMDYFANACVMFQFQADQFVKSKIELVKTYYDNRLIYLQESKQIKDHAKSNPQNIYKPIPMDLLYWNMDIFEKFVNKNPDVFQFNPFINDVKESQFHSYCTPDFTHLSQQRTDQIYLGLIDFLKQKHNKKIVICCPSSGAASRLIHNFDEQNFSLPFIEESDLKNENLWPNHWDHKIAIAIYPIDKTFETDQTIFISYQQLFGEHQKNKTTNSKNALLSIKEISQLNEGDFVVHREHGIAQYAGLVTVKVDKLAHDCLKLIFYQDDKLLLPVENIDSITRYGNDETVVQLDRLGSANWQMRKAKVKKRIRDAADYLIKLAAERALKKADIFEPSLYWQEFEDRFEYVETQDQQKAIQETLQDLASGQPMDRLVCGDVGFGKTEVALRAAFATVSCKKQVAIITPTTLLCRQHYQTFKKRFAGFPFKIAQLSRLVGPKEKESILHELNDGAIHIIIATHSLLNSQVKFANLGLLIIDEEQHFGVKQKEKLKELKADVHILTLTATPIPRTLQLALTGVRSMSLITTPPVDRRVIQTYVMPFDDFIIREAILREYHRSGQVFYVCPRLAEIDQLKNTLQSLVPEIKIAVAHGQMPAKELENVMSQFCDGQYDLLLSTNIIESGIDVANANTLIIHRADLFGLSQLYQLRGRVGRGKVQAYAYFTMPPNQAITANAQKRLEFLQTLDKLGAGFTLASYDMDIRGAGNILGEEQSGHIREVGVELYQLMLQEAVANIKQEQQLQNHSQKMVVDDTDWSVKINIGLSILIPDYYVPDMDLRLSLYKEIGQLKTPQEIDDFAITMIDRFGPLTQEVKNLLDIIAIKQLCKKASIEKLDVGEKGMSIRFYQNTFPRVDNLLEYIQKNNNFIKIRPDQSLVITNLWGADKENYIAKIKKICGQLARLCE